MDNNQVCKKDLETLERMLAFAKGTSAPVSYHTTIPRKRKNILQGGVIQETEISADGRQKNTSYREATLAQKLERLQEILYHSSGEKV